jgi:hypothetical protein
MRAIKRERYGKKELARLKKVLGIEENGDIEMKNIANIATGNFSQSLYIIFNLVPEVKQFSVPQRFKITHISDEAQIPGEAEDASTMSVS